jgi:hypothetical protein
MSEQSSLSLLLGIPDIRIVSTRLVREQEVVIEVESTQTVVCHRCGCTISEFDGYGEPLRLDYHPLSGGASSISFRPKRFRCSYCHVTTSQQLNWPPADLQERELGR